MPKFSVEYKDGSPSKEVDVEDFFGVRDMLVDEFNKAKESVSYSGGIMGPADDDKARAVLIFAPDFKIVAVAKVV